MARMDYSQITGELLVEIWTIGFGDGAHSITITTRIAITTDIIITTTTTTTTITITMSIIITSTPE